MCLQNLQQAARNPWLQPTRQLPKCAHLNYAIRDASQVSTDPHQSTRSHQEYYAHDENP